MPPIKLLTAEDVAGILRIDVRTVYKHADKLGGFYPFGVKVLRFDREVFLECLEGQASGGGVEVRIRIPKKTDNGIWIQDKARSPVRTRKAQKSREKIQPDPGRHGL